MNLHSHIKPVLRISDKRRKCQIGAGKNHRGRFLPGAAPLLRGIILSEMRHRVTSVRERLEHRANFRFGQGRNIDVEDEHLSLPNV